MGRISNLDNYNPYQKPSILVLNQEFYNQFHSNWQYSLALSYRIQKEYSIEESPAGASTGIKKELRLYARYSYIRKNARFKSVNTFRQEFRKFFDKDFNHSEENFQLRSRLRSQVTCTLDKNKTHHIVLSGEALFSISNDNEPESGWGDFNYRESRFCLYYSLSAKSYSMTFNLGYMNNLLGNTSITDVHYLAFDIIWENPYHKFKSWVNKPVDRLE
jgi:hypothetical protein